MMNEENQQNLTEEQNNSVYSNEKVMIDPTQSKLNQMLFEGNYGMNGKIKKILSVTGTVIIVLTSILSVFLFFAVFSRGFGSGYYDYRTAEIFEILAYLLFVAMGLAVGFLLHGISKLIHNTDVMVELMKK